MMISAASILYAHGAKYEILSRGVLGVKASYEAGDPMADARVMVYAPNSSEVFFLTKTDKNGIASFSPDRAGLWTLMIRDNTGHGLRVNLNVDDTMTVSQGDRAAGTTTPLQKIIMAICVIWGLMGTALYFKRK